MLQVLNSGFFCNALKERNVFLGNGRTQVTLLLNELRFLAFILPCHAHLHACFLFTGDTCPTVGVGDVESAADALLYVISW